MLAVRSAVDATDPLTAKILHEFVRARIHAPDAQAAIPTAVHNVCAAKRVLEVRALSIRSALEIDNGQSRLRIDDDDLPDVLLVAMWRWSGEKAASEGCEKG